MDTYPYKASPSGEMEPIAHQYWNVCIHYVKSLFYRKVEFYESVPPWQCIDLGALAAGVTSGRTNITQMDMYDDEFGQYRFFPLDPIQVRLFLPRGSAKADLMTAQPPVDQNIRVFNPSLSMTEIFVWQQNRPAVEAINGSGYNLAMTRIIAKGFRYHTKEIYARTLEEKRAVESLASLPENAKKKEKDLMEKLIDEGRLPCVHVWASGMAAGL